MSAGTSNALNMLGTTDTISSGITISGQHASIAGDLLTNNAMIDANEPDISGGTGIQVRFSNSTGTGTNAGTIEATAGGTATAGSSSAFTNTSTGTLTATGSGSTLTIGSGGELANPWSSTNGTISVNNAPR